MILFYFKSELSEQLTVGRVYSVSAQVQTLSICTGANTEMFCLTNAKGRTFQMCVGNNTNRF